MKTEEKKIEEKNFRTEIGEEELKEKGEFEKTKAEILMKVEGILHNNQVGYIAIGTLKEGIKVGIQGIGVYKIDPIDALKSILYSMNLSNSQKAEVINYMIKD